MSWWISDMIAYSDHEITKSSNPGKLLVNPYSIVMQQAVEQIQPTLFPITYMENRISIVGVKDGLPKTSLLSLHIKRVMQRIIRIQV